MSLLADLQPEAQDPKTRLRTLRKALDDARDEAARLEARHEARASLREQLEAIEAETRALREEGQAAAKRIEAEERAAAVVAQRARWTDPASTGPPDPAAQARAAEALRRRKQGLEKLHAIVQDPSAPLKEEEALRHLESVLAALDKEVMARSRELVFRSKQVEQARRAQRDRGSGGGGSVSTDATAPDGEDGGQTYLQRLQAAAKSTAESMDKEVGTAAALRDEWQRWWQLLSMCARSLQARADAGEGGAVVLPGDDSAPAFQVLELMRTLCAEVASLRKRRRDVDAQEEALQSKLDSLRAKVSAQDAALRQAQQRNARAKAAEEAAIANSRAASPTF